MGNNALPTSVAVVPASPWPKVLQARLGVDAGAIAQFCQRWQIAELSLFGSVLRDDFGPESDVDLLVSYEPGHRLTLAAIGEMQTEIEALLGRAVDLTEQKNLKNPFSKREILGTARIVYPLERTTPLAIVRANPVAQDQVRNNTALWDMVEAMRRILRFITGVSYEDYIENDLLRSAVERQLEVLGEAANRVTPAFQAEHPEIDWRNIIGLRNVIIHRYDQLENERIWHSVTLVVPGLLQIVESLVPPFGDSN